MSRDDEIERARGIMTKLALDMHKTHAVVTLRGKRRHDEQAYSIAYRTLVRLGVEPRLRGKYR